MSATIALDATRRALTNVLAELASRYIADDATGEVAGLYEDLEGWVGDREAVALWAEAMTIAGETP